jgi:hypothetical protein
MSNDCQTVRSQLEAFLDNELGGQARVLVGEHLEQCERCALEARDLREIGQALRFTSPSDVELDQCLSGFGSRLVGQVRAEARFSWNRAFARVFDDWRWTIVASGSLAATFVTTGILSAILSFGPAPAREDSLSALLGNLASPPGYLFVLVSAVDDEEVTALLQVANGQPSASRVVTALAGQMPDRGPSETSRQIGLKVNVGAMDRQTRARAVALFDELTSPRTRQRSALERPVNVRAVRLITSVTAKS